VAAAVERALTVPLDGHHRLLLCAADIAASTPSLTAAGRNAPGVPVRHAAAFASDPWRALVDCSAAARVLGWRPRYTWAGRGAADAGR
jgi:nucleoside-diphosphate-sugar epimerase